jgi:glycosyltransferase involved in cell wall biosynthesis
MPSLDVTTAAPGALAAADTRPRVYLNGRFYGQRVTGVQRYARETLRCLDDMLAEGHGDAAQWTLLVPQGTQTPPFKRLAVQSVGRLSGHLWEQIELPWAARDGLLFSLGLTGPLVKRNQVITVHDASVVRVPQAFNRVFRWGYRLLVSRVARRAPRTMTVSRFSAAEATACFGAPPERVAVTTEGWQHLAPIEPDDSLLDRHGLRGVPFVLAVSSPTPNKNFRAIAQALMLMGADAPPCVVVGAADGSIFRADGSTAGGVGMMRVGYVSDAQLKALYQHAQCFVFPSFYEGFGIPPLEAMACGCPVIASTAPALREVCGDAAMYFDPSRPDELAQCLRSLFGSAPLRARMTLAGHTRSQIFSWRKAAALNLDVINELVRR